jgi:hypothetical protein
MRRARSTSSAVVVALRDCAFRRRAACLKAGESHQEPSPSPPNELPPEELPVDDEAADEDAVEEGSPVVASAPAAAVRLVGWSPSRRWDRPGSCRPAPSESRTTGRGFAGLVVTALAAEASDVGLVDGSTALAAADVALALSVAFFGDVGCSVSVADCAAAV